MNGLFSSIENLVGQVGAFAGGPPMLIFLVGTGLYLTIVLTGPAVPEIVVLALAGAGKTKGRHRRAG